MVDWVIDFLSEDDNVDDNVLERWTWDEHQAIAEKRRKEIPIFEKSDIIGEFEYDKFGEKILYTQ